jgi:hypothetical protein
MADAAQLVKVYVKIRDAKAAKAKEMDEAIAVLDEQLDLVAQQLLEICKETGQDGGKTEFGSFTRKVSTRYNATNWDAMYKFVKEHDAFDLLERRISQLNLQTFLQENPDHMPEGLNVVSKYAITVRRATK